MKCRCAPVYGTGRALVSRVPLPSRVCDLTLERVLEHLYSNTVARQLLERSNTSSGQVLERSNTTIPRSTVCCPLDIQKMDTRCNSLHKKTKYGSKLSQNCHVELRNRHLELKTLTFPYLDTLPSFLALRECTVEHRSNTSFCQVLEQGRCSNTLPRPF